jgi:hypothetical protein
MLCDAIAANWPALSGTFTSSISLSTPTHFPNGTRAVSRSLDFDDWSIERFKKSSDSRFVLRADLSRFYHTIYTHSLPWAIHTKQAAKADHSDNLYGNLIDKRVRNTQDQQTIGLPVGPDTSFILAEVVGARIDQELIADLGSISGIRYVDDFHLYFNTRSEAENAYSSLSRIAKAYELEVNERKTEIFEGPDTGEPPWKTALKLQPLRPPAVGQRFSLISFASKAFELAKEFPNEGVLTYAVKKAFSTPISQENEPIFEAFLRAALVQDTSTFPLVTKIIYDLNSGQQLVAQAELLQTLSTLALFHAPLRHQYEVSWILWIFKLLTAQVPGNVLDAVSRMEDPIVALVALDLRASGLASGLDTAHWAPLIAPEHLYGEHWLLAYEAVQKGWAQPQNNYVAADPFFGALLTSGVTFYEPPHDSGVSYVTLDAGWY